MGIRITDTLAIQFMFIDEKQDFIVRTFLNLWQVCEETQKSCSVFDIPYMQLPNDQGMRRNLTFQQELLKQLVSLPEKIDPNRCIDQYHYLRGIVVALGELPANLDSLLALSR
jgi:hypothetical protein